MDEEEYDKLLEKRYTDLEDLKTERDALRLAYSRASDQLRSLGRLSGVDPKIQARLQREKELFKKKLREVEGKIKDVWAAERADWAKLKKQMDSDWVMGLDDD